MWLKDANCIASEYKGFDNDGTIEDGRVTWNHAFDFINGINDGTYANCGAGYTGWRLPNKKELISLIHDGYHEPALSNIEGTGQWLEGDPFNNVESYPYYWSSTTYAFVPGNGNAWCVSMSDGYVVTNIKSYDLYVWPVRGGH